MLPTPEYIPFVPYPLYFHELKSCQFKYDIQTVEASLGRSIQCDLFTKSSRTFKEKEQQFDTLEYLTRPPEHETAPRRGRGVLSVVISPALRPARPFHSAGVMSINEANDGRCRKERLNTSFAPECICSK